MGKEDRSKFEKILFGWNEVRSTIMNQRKMGVIISYANMVLNIILGIFYTPFMLRHLGEHEYGIYSLAGSLTAFITMLDLGFNQTLVRYLSKCRAIDNKEEESLLLGFFMKLYCGIALIACVVGSVLLYIYPMMCKKTMSLDELHTFRIVFLVLLLNIVVSFPLCVFSAILNTYERFIYMKVVSLVCVILKYGCITIVLVLGYKSIAIAVISAVISILSQLCYMIYCIRKICLKFKFGKIGNKLKKEIVAFSTFIFLNIVIDYLYNNTDKLILGSVSGTVAVSVYAIGIQFTTYFQEMSSAICGVFLPRISYLFEHDKNMRGISEMFNKVGRIQMIILFFVLSAFVVFGNSFIQLWVGGTYSDSYLIAMIIMLPAIVPLTQNLGITILRVMNMHKYRSYMYLFIAILNLGISIPLAMRYDGIGSAIGTCIANLLGQILFMNFFYAKVIKLDIREYWKNFIKFFIYSIPFVIVFRRCTIESWYAFIFWAVIYSAAYLGGCLTLLANRYEKDLVKSVIRRMVHKND